MKYAIIKCVNGNYAIEAEGITDIHNAMYNANSLCASLWNASDVITACVRIVDENFGMVNGFNQIITHPAPVEVEE